MTLETTLETTLNLKNKKYDMNILKKHIYALSLREILETQDIDEVFIIQFILNKDYQLTEDDKISIEMVIQIKKNIDISLLLELYHNWDGTVDKAIDFETYMNEN
jgi:hypothetical protein